MFYDDYMSRETIANFILLSPKARELISNFVIKLNQQGAIKSFINGEKLDALMAELRKQNVLTGNFEWVDFSSEHLLENISLDLVQFFAAHLFYNKIYDSDEIVEMLESMIRVMSKPENAYHLYTALFEHTAKMSNAFINALEADLNANPEQSYILWTMLDEALPAIGKPILRSTFWVCTKFRTFEKIDFNAILKNEPFEQCYQNIFKNAPITPSGYSKERIYEDVQYYFKCLLIDDIFGEITNSKQRTSKNITNALNTMYETRSIYVYLRYARAFFIVLLEDIERLKNQNKPPEPIPILPAYFNNGYGNIPS